MQRGGRIRAFPIERVTIDTLKQAVAETVSQDAHMMTDDFSAYVGPVMGRRKHETVTHSRREYARGNVHTNTIEGFFGLLKRGIVGSFHHVSKGHLHRYVSEFEFRYNTRTALGYTDGQRAGVLVLGAEGKRLTFKQPSGSSAAGA